MISVANGSFSSRTGLASGRAQATFRGPFHKPDLCYQVVLGPRALSMRRDLDFALRRGVGRPDTRRRCLAVGCGRYRPASVADWCFMKTRGITKDSEPSKDGALLALAKKTQSSIQLVTALYDEEVAKLEANSQVKKYIGVIARRRVAQRLCPK